MQKQEFLSLSMRQWAALQEQHRDACRHRDRMVEVMGAQLVAMVANTGFKGWEEPRNPQEFMPSEWSKAKAEPKRKRLTKEERRKIAASWRDYWKMACGIKLA